MMKRLMLPIAVLSVLLGIVGSAEASLVSFWTGNGTASDSVGTNPGAWFGTTSYAPGHQVGRQAFGFDGNSYVQAGTASLPTGNADRTLDLWFNISKTASGESFFGGYGAFGTFDAAYSVGALNTNQLFFSQWGGATVSPAPVSTGTWHNMAVTNTGNSVVLYLDGISVATGSLSISTASGTDFYIGRLDSYRNLTGLVDDVGIYDTALSASEIRAIFDQSQAVPEPSTLIMSSLFLGMFGTGWVRNRLRRTAMPA